MSALHERERDLVDTEDALSYDIEEFIEDFARGNEQKYHFIGDERIKSGNKLMLNLRKRF